MAIPAAQAQAMIALQDEMRGTRATADLLATGQEEIQKAVDLLKATAAAEAATAAVPAEAARQAAAEAARREEEARKQRERVALRVISALGFAQSSECKNSIFPNATYPTGLGD